MDGCGYNLDETSVPLTEIEKARPETGLGRPSEASQLFFDHHAIMQDTKIAPPGTQGLPVTGR